MFAELQYQLSQLCSVLHSSVFFSNLICICSLHAALIFSHYSSAPVCGFQLQHMGRVCEELLTKPFINLFFTWALIPPVLPLPHAPLISLFSSIYMGLRTTDNVTIKVFMIILGRFSMNFEILLITSIGRRCL